MEHMKNICCLYAVYIYDGGFIFCGFCPWGLLSMGFLSGGTVGGGGGGKCPTLQHSLLFLLKIGIVW